MSTDNQTLIPRRVIEDKAKACQYKRGEELLRKDIIRAVNESAEKAEKTGEFKLPSSIGIPEIFKDGAKGYNIPSGVISWLAAAGYKVCQREVDGYKCSYFGLE